MRVRGVATDECNRKLVRNRLQSGESVSSFDQPSGEVKNAFSSLQSETVAVKVFSVNFRGNPSNLILLDFDNLTAQEPN